MAPLREFLTPLLLLARAAPTTTSPKITATTSAIQRAATTSSTQSGTATDVIRSSATTSSIRSTAATATAPAEPLVGAPVDALLDGLTLDEITATNVNTTYDYIIVGGGGGGMLMAMRLTEDPNVTVAVIEAGSLSTAYFTYQPGQLATSVFVDPTIPLNEKIDYQDVTVPLKANGNPMHFAQGKMIGGSTARGFSAYTRPTVGTMQKWADAVGDEAYTWDSFYPYLKKSVQFTPPNITERGANTSDIKFDASHFDPTGGPLQVSFSNYASPYSTWMKQAWQGLGVKQAVDFNNGTVDGVQYMNTNIQPEDMHRSYAASFFLEARNRSNMVVFAQTQARQIMFSATKVANGVMVAGVDSKEFKITARKEVICSAGVFRTPQLLMLSGIGNATVLKQFNIAVIADLPGVGMNLSDQPFVGSTYQVNMNTTSQEFNLNFNNAANDTFLQGRGPLAATLDMAVFEGVLPQSVGNLSAKVQSTLATYPQDWPVFQYIPVNSDLVLFRTTASKPPIDSLVTPNYGSIAASLSAPQSRGSVTLRSANITDPPVIDIGYLNDDQDVELLMMAFKRSREAWKEPSLQPALIGNEYWPGYDLVPDNDDAIRKHVIENVMPIWEPTSSCAMGKKGDKFAVVDSNAKVFGVTGLRIVDASALPFQPPGHSASSVFALAELMADRMKKGM